MFDRIAGRYDRANTVLSLGRHQSWRRRLVKWSDPPAGGAVLDVATGTGDLALLYKDAVGEEGRVVGLDFSKEMLALAREKARQNDCAVEFREGDALRLPFGDHEFDVASVAFGIRNLDDPRRGVEELARVVRAGGRVAILEFGQPRGPLAPLYRAYNRFVIPRVGGRITGHRAAYEYLDRTAASFPSGTRFVELMEATGKFQSVQHRRLMSGLVNAYIGLVK